MYIPAVLYSNKMHFCRRMIFRISILFNFCVYILSLAHVTKSSEKPLNEPFVVHSRLNTASIIKKYLHDSLALESFVEIILNNKELDHETIKRKFTSTLISHVPNIDHIIKAQNDNKTRKKSHEDNHFKETVTKLLRRNHNDLRTHPNADTRTFKYTLAAEPGTEYFDPVSATGEKNKGCRKKANKYRTKCLYGGELMDQTSNMRRL